MERSDRTDRPRQSGHCVMLHAPNACPSEDLLQTWRDLGAHLHLVSDAAAAMAVLATCELEVRRAHAKKLDVDDGQSVHPSHPRQVGESIALLIVEPDHMADWSELAAAVNRYLPGAAQIAYAAHGSPTLTELKHGAGPDSVLLRAVQDSITDTAPKDVSARKIEPAVGVPTEADEDDAPRTAEPAPAPAPAPAVATRREVAAPKPDPMPVPTIVTRPALRLAGVDDDDNAPAPTPSSPSTQDATSATAAAKTQPSESTWQPTSDAHQDADDLENNALVSSAELEMLLQHEDEADDASSASPDIADSDMPTDEIDPGDADWSTTRSTGIRGNKENPDA